MKWLVTGANGFLGQNVVARFLERGDQVRALVRPAADLTKIDWIDSVEMFRGDLRRCPNLAGAFEDVDGLVHLAAAVVGSPEEQFAAAVVGTEKLLTAMSQTKTNRLVFISSFSVYDWNAATSTVDESTPIEKEHLYERDGYAIAKTWQEKVVRNFASKHGWNLTVLRPGFIWGRGNEWCVGLGDQIGNRYVVIGPRRRLPMTHVLNCADCIVHAAGHEGAYGETFNIVDDQSPSAWRMTGDYLRHQGRGGYRIPVPYHAGFAMAMMANFVSKMVFGPQGRLPSLFVPRRYVARFKSARFPNGRLATKLGWSPPWSYAECLERTYCQSEVPPKVSSAVSGSVTSGASPNR